VVPPRVRYCTDWWIRAEALGAAVPASAGSVRASRHGMAVSGVPGHVAAPAVRRLSAGRGRGCGWPASGYFGISAVAGVPCDLPRTFRTADLWFNSRCELPFQVFFVDLSWGPVLKRGVPTF
jgi:hypothetical protein